MNSGTDANWVSIIEGVLFVSSTPVSLEKLREILGTLTLAEIRNYLHQLQSAYEDRRSALQVREVAGGYQIYTRPEIAPWICKLT